MTSATSTNHVVCVHGVDIHYVGFEKCWKCAIDRHLGGTIDFNFTAVMWNCKDDDIHIAADCDADFPAGWIKVDPDRGIEDAIDYVKHRRLENAFRTEAIRRCRVELARIRSKHPQDAIHVIGHSLGSVIAYQALHGLGESLGVRTLITVGSVLNFDLGIVPLLEYEMRPGPGEKLKRPPVGKWVNIMDYRDFCFQLTEESVFEKFEYGPDDLDITGDVFESQGHCPALPPIDAGPIFSRTINDESVCAHLYYFDLESNAGRIMAKALENR
ncbi:MAG: hypothetical protein WDZ48_01310 [Pirellulales bacterium]